MQVQNNHGVWQYFQEIGTVSFGDALSYHVSAELPVRPMVVAFMF